MDSLLSSTLFSIFINALKACGVVFLLLLARAIIWMLNMLVIAPLTDPLKNVQGPEGSALQNHFREVMDPRVTPDTHENWSRTYGKTFRFQGFGWHDYRLLSLDFRVMSHVLNSPVYEKPWQTRSFLSRLLGKGVFAMEGDEHKRLRRLILPSFSTHTVKTFSPIFFQKAEELRDLWETLITDPESHHGLQEGGCPPLPPPPYEPENPLAELIIDVSRWMSRATFDVIGLAGFDYRFHALQDETEEVYLAYRRIFDVADKGPGLKGLVQLYLPWLEKIFPDEGERITQESLRTIRETGERLVQNKKAAILAEKANSREINEKDILSLLIKSNLSSDESHRLSDSELLDQISTFLFAGSDSTSLAIAWCLHLLSLHPSVQNCLRNEVMSLSPCASETADGRSDLSLTNAIDALPYLDAVVRETLRLCPPVHGTIRVATRDDRIPISSPILLRDGTLIREGETISIRKGSYVHIPIEGLNFSPEIWGEDARLFNPDRWLSLPTAARSPANPGITNLMTFSFGPHACPGWKFSLLEVKIFIATLLPYFVFEPATEIRKTNSILTRPYVYDQFEFGARLPIKVGRYYP